MMTNIKRIPFPPLVDGRRVTASEITTACGTVYQAIIYMTHAEATAWLGYEPEHNEFIHMIVENPDLWDLREYFQDEEPKHRQRSRCY
jgi:hypothetical protein